MNCLQKKIVFLCLFAGLMFAASGLFAQNPSTAKRFNLAVYATGTKDDNELDKSLLTIIQNRAITKLTCGGSEYQLIERSNDFLKQIQSEQKMQSSGEVADGQIAEIGAGFGAEKICVVSITIVQKYLYIATRIVDVATKTSFESGDAEEKLYLSIPQLTKTLDNSLNKMMNTKPRSKVSSETQKNVGKSEPASNVSSEAQKMVENTQSTSNVSSEVQKNDQKSEPASNVSYEAQKMVENTIPRSHVFSETSNYQEMNFKTYKREVKSGKDNFFCPSRAYQEYKKYNKSIVAGSVLMTVGTLLAGVSAPLFWYSGYKIQLVRYWGFDPYPLVYHCDTMIPAIISVSIGGCLFIAGMAVLCAAPSHLKKSYGYYINGEQHTASFNVHPYVDRNNTFGAGITLQF